MASRCKDCKYRRYCGACSHPVVVKEDGSWRFFPGYTDRGHVQQPPPEETPDWCPLEAGGLNGLLIIDQTGKVLGKIVPV